MTTLYEDSVNCYVCGHLVEVILIGSTNQFGSCDLDMRPAEMARSTMPYWVHHCPYCGYCAPRLESGIPLVKDVVKSPTYQQIVLDTAIPELARIFRGVSHLSFHMGELVSAGHFQLNAAWVCDDEGVSAKATACRVQAIHLFTNAIEKGESIFDQQSLQHLFLAELHRRAKQYIEAKQELDLCIQSEDMDEELRPIIQYQHYLVDRQDAGCYTIDDAIHYKQAQ